MSSLASLSLPDVLESFLTMVSVLLSFVVVLFCVALAWFVMWKTFLSKFQVHKKWQQSQGDRVAPLREDFFLLTDRAFASTFSSSES